MCEGLRFQHINNISRLIHAGPEPVISCSLEPTLYTQIFTSGKAIVNCESASIASSFSWRYWIICEWALAQIRNFIRIWAKAHSHDHLYPRAEARGNIPNEL